MAIRLCYRDNIKLPTSELPSSWESWFHHFQALKLFLKTFLSGVICSKPPPLVDTTDNPFFLTPVMNRYINGELCLEIFQSRIPIRHLSEEAACLLPCYYVGRSSSAHNKITINEAMLAHQFIINNRWHVQLKSRLTIKAKIIMHRTNFHPWPPKKKISKHVMR